MMCGVETGLLRIIFQNYSQHCLFRVFMADNLCLYCDAGQLKIEKKFLSNGGIERKEEERSMGEDSKQPLYY